MKNKYFLNATDKPFTWSWNKEPWTFQPGEKKVMQDYLADHFAKHLTDSMLISDGYMVDDQRRPDYLAKCLFEIGDDVQMSPEKAEFEALNNRTTEVPEVPEAPKKRIGRPKKTEVEKFEGLDEK